MKPRSMSLSPAWFQQAHEVGQKVHLNEGLLNEVDWVHWLPCCIIGTDIGDKAAAPIVPTVTDGYRSSDDHDGVWHIGVNVDCEAVAACGWRLTDAGG